jgi:hypothetical protein
MSALSDFKHFKFFTDEELANYDFTVEDPRDIKGLVWSMPEGVTVIALLHRYVFPGEKLNCIVCKEARHYNGGVALLSDGSKCLIGNDCGRKRFGKELWDQRANEYEKAKDRRDLHDRSAQISTCVKTQISSLTQLEGAYRAYGRLQRETIDCVRDDYLRLRHDLREGGGQLSIVVRKSDVARGVFGSRGSSTAKSNKLAQSDFETRPIGRIRGYKFLSDQSPLGLLRDGLNGLREVENGLAKQRLTDLERKKLHRKYDDSRQAIQMSAEVYRQAFVFHNSANYKVLGDWLNQLSDNALEARLSSNAFATRLKVAPHSVGNPWRTMPAPGETFTSQSSVFELIEKVWPIAGS